MNKVLLLIDNEFEDMEAMYPFYRMREAGFEVEVVAHKKDTYHGKYGYPLEATKVPSECHLIGVVGVIVPGGAAPDHMRTRPEMVGLIKDAVNSGIVIGAICHGIQLLIEADVIRGKHATCYKSVKVDLVNAGALYMDTEVVVDDGIVTSREPSDLPIFTSTLIAILRESAMPSKVVV